MCYKKHQINLSWADWMHKIHSFIPIFHNSSYFTRLRTIVLFRNVNTDCFAQGKSKWFSKVLMKITLLSLVKMSEVTFCACSAWILWLLYLETNSDFTYSPWNRREEADMWQRCVWSGVTQLWLIQRNLFMSCCCFKNVC